MITNKHIGKFIVFLMTVSVIFCLLTMLYADKVSAALGGSGVTMEYESELFDTDEVMEINIEMSEEDWNTMLSNALSEEYYTCDVTINGEEVSNVAIRPKGNTSLSSIAMNPDTDRYSLKLEFDHFVDGQTCYGLDKLILNNNYADATNMKEAIIYDMFGYMGAEASLYNYAKVCLNGEYIGVYLALEAVEQSFMLRNFGTRDGELYKPDSMEMGGGEESSKSGESGPPSGGFPGGDFNPDDMPDMGDFNPDDMPDMSDFNPGDMPTKPDEDESESGERPDRGDFNPGEKSGMPGGGMMGGNGANLNYSDDDLDSYTTIWDGSITDSTDKDHKRVVKALKNISEGNDLEEYLDIDNVLKYMAVHAFAVNEDSLSGSMAHNYYLYEYDGKLNIFPWDYNLSFGGMGAGKDSDATSMVNDAVDTPFDGTDFFDALLEDEEYLEIYHAYLSELVEYVNSGRFDEVYSRIRSQIDELVKEDPTAFYGYDEYVAAAETLYDTIKLRAESIEGQLNGSIPSTDEGQKEDGSSLVDASNIDVKSMGTFDMGGMNDEDSSHKAKTRNERREEKREKKQRSSE